MHGSILPFLRSIQLAHEDKTLTKKDYKASNLLLKLHRC